MHGRHIQEQVPRKQGLKLSESMKSILMMATIQEQVPRKQGLKLRSICLAIDAIGTIFKSKFHENKD